MQPEGQFDVEAQGQASEGRLCANVMGRMLIGLNRAHWGFTYSLISLQLVRLRPIFPEGMLFAPINLIRLITRVVGSSPTPATKQIKGLQVSTCKPLCFSGAM